MNNNAFESSIFHLNSDLNDDIHESSFDDECLSDNDFLDFLSRIRENTPIPDNNASNIETDEWMDADDSHNRSVLLARLGKYKQATKICKEALKRFPNNTDLLADMIKYSAEIGDTDTASKYYAMLKSLPLNRWTWRAFTFSFDFLVDEDPFTNEEECRFIVNNYKKYFPHEEKAYISESKLEEVMGNSERSMEVLEDAIHRYNNAAQCALHLANMQIERGLYEEAIGTTEYGIAASAEVQLSINLPLLCYLRVLAKDHTLHKKNLSHKEVSTDEISELTAEYELLLSEFPELTQYKETITSRLKIMKFIKPTS